MIKLETIVENGKTFEGGTFTVEELRADLTAKFADALFFPNSILPKSMHKKKTWEVVDNFDGGESEKQFGRTGTSILKEFERKEKISQHQQDKLDRAERIAKYAAMVEAGEQIEYDVNDEHRLYRHQFDFAIFHKD